MLNAVFAVWACLPLVALLGGMAFLAYLGVVTAVEEFRAVEWGNGVVTCLMVWVLLGLGAMIVLLLVALLSWGLS